MDRIQFARRTLHVLNRGIAAVEDLADEVGRLADAVEDVAADGRDDD
jgi:hypothetical protein